MRPDTPCVEWPGPQMNKGYGRAHIPGSGYGHAAAIFGISPQQVCNIAKDRCWA